MIAVSLATENICSAVEADNMEIGTALEYNTRLRYRLQQLKKKRKHGRI